MVRMLSTIRPAFVTPPVTRGSRCVLQESFEYLVKVLGWTKFTPCVSVALDMLCP